MHTTNVLVRVAVSFDETNLLPHAGLLPAAALAQQIGLAGLIDRRLGLASQAANSGTKALTVIESILACGDSVDDTNLLRTGASTQLFDRSARPRRSGAGCARSSGPTSASSTRSRGSCWPDCGPPAPDQPTRAGH